MQREKKRVAKVSEFADPKQVQEEITYLEARIEQIGYEGDCAYERAMSRFFTEQANIRRAWLQTI